MCWDIIGAEDAKLKESQLGLLVPKVFWDITHRWVSEEKKCSYFLLEKKEQEAAKVKKEAPTKYKRGKW